MRRLLPALVWLALISACAPPPPVAMVGERIPPPCDKELLLQVGVVPVFRVRGEAPIFYKTGMRIDADGAPNAYHPEDQGLDILKHAGRPGDWQGIITNAQGQPSVQGPKDPYPGYYISQTSLFDKTKEWNDPARYVDARAIPYLVLPGEPVLMEQGRVNLGDFAVVINARNGRMAFAIFADRGPRGKIGEGSIALASVLKIPASPRTGGVKDDIIYVVFPGSGNGEPRSPEEINREGARAFAVWGGRSRLAACYPEYSWTEDPLTSAK